MAYSSVSLIRSSDSVLTAFGWTDDKGGIAIDHIPVEKYVLLISRPTFVDYEEVISLSDNEIKDIGTIHMITKANLLKEVIIREKMDAIRVRGDTTEFLVDSFLTNKNSNVEDLLKKLPGLQVDKNGKITAQGQEVKKVLVDGEEFFGDDPTVATKNLRAENVETVQVFDKKSDQAAFTGIDDGTKEKTINLKLKEEAKKGYFGKVSGGAGTERRYEHDAMLNFFRQKRKFSVYGAASNTNKTQLSWRDAENYSGGRGNMEVSDDGYIYSYYSGSDDNVDFNGVGIPETWFAGTHYSDKLKEDKHAITINGTRKEMRVSGFDNNYTQYILPDTMYFNNQLKNFNNYRNATAANGKYELKIDSLSTLRFTFNARQGVMSSRSTFVSENLNSDSQVVNTNNRASTNDGTNELLTSALTWNKKFKTQGRSLSLSVNQSHTANASEGFLRSSTTFTDAATGKQQTDTIDQKKITDINTEVFGGRATYTQPLSKKWFTVFDYDVGFTSNKSSRFAYSSQNNEYTLLDSLLSNDFRYNILTHKGGIVWRFVDKKLNYSFGGKVSYTDLKQENLVKNTIQNQYFTNIFPSASISYKVKNTSSISLRYDGSTRQPTLQQIQPVADNSNPLDIVLGNSNLRQSFRNNVSATYNSYKPITGRSVYANIWHNIVDDDFTSFDYVDEYGRKTHQTVNVDGNRSTGFYAYYYFDIKKLGIGIGNSFNGRVSTNKNYINGLANVNNYQSVSFGPNINYSIDNKLDVGIRTDFNYNHSQSTLRPDVVTKYWIQYYEVYTDITLPKRFVIEVESEFNIRQRTSEFDKDLNTVILNLSVSKKLFSKYPLEMKISGRDLFNQNIGFSRNANSNYITENTHTVLKRYFMFTLIWNFSNGGAAQVED